MLQTKSFVNPELLSVDNIKNFENICNKITFDRTNILISSTDEKTNLYVFNSLRQKLEKKSIEEKKISIYMHEKLESFLADSLIGAFDVAFSRLAETCDKEKIPTKKILLIRDLLQLNEREFDLLINLNKNKEKYANPTIILFNNPMKKNSDNHRLEKLCHDSIKWEPEKLIEPSVEVKNNNGNKSTPNNLTSSTKKNIFFLLIKLVITILLFVAGAILILTITGNTETPEKYINKILNNFELKEENYFFNKPSIDNHINSNFHEVNFFNFSELSQFHIASGYLIQYSAHAKKIDALRWISGREKIKNFKLIKLKKNSDNSAFYAIVSPFFQSYQQAIEFASNDKFSGKQWVRSLKSIKKLHTMTLNREKNL